MNYSKKLKYWISVFLGIFVDPPYSPSNSKFSKSNEASLRFSYLVKVLIGSQTFYGPFVEIHLYDKDWCNKFIEAVICFCIATKSVKLTIFFFVITRNTCLFIKFDSTGWVLWKWKCKNLNVELNSSFSLKPMKYIKITNINAIKQ